MNWLPEFRRLIVLTVVCSIATAGEPVSTTAGPVSGTESRDDAIEVFKGIPFAEPPIGELRWRPPQPPRPWTEVRECTEFGGMSLPKNERRGQSEDCLYLNVWTPRERPADKLPVFGDSQPLASRESVERVVRRFASRVFRRPGSSYSHQCQTSGVN